MDKHLSTLEALPQDTLFLVLDHAPALRYASRYLHALAEERDGHRLHSLCSSRPLRSLLDRALQSPAVCEFLKEHSYRVSDYAVPASRKTSLPSARSLLAFLSRDYCFFSPRNLDENDSSVKHIQSGLDPWDLKSGPWNHVTSTHCSRAGTCLYAANVTSLKLVHRTRLQPGKYEVYVDVRTENAFSLLPIRFMVRENHLVRQSFSPYPPARLVTGAHEHFANRSGKIYLGDISVASPNVYNLDDEASSHDDSLIWPLVEFEIKDSGAHSELQFDQLVFKPKPAELSLQQQLDATGVMTPPRQSWELVPSEVDATDRFVSPAMAAAYLDLVHMKAA